MSQLEVAENIPSIQDVGRAGINHPGPVVQVGPAQKVVNAVLVEIAGGSRSSEPIVDGLREDLEGIGGDIEVAELGRIRASPEVGVDLLVQEWNRRASVLFLETPRCVVIRPGNHDDAAAIHRGRPMGALEPERVKQVLHVPFVVRRRYENLIEPVVV